MSQHHLSEEDFELWRRPPTVRYAYADYAHGILHYRVVDTAAPKAPPLLVLHQSGSSGRCYERLAAELGRDRIVMVLDTPGFGASDPVPHAPLIADFASAAEELLDQLDFGFVDLFGDHTGAATAIEMAVRRPGRIGRLAVNALPIFSDGELASLRGRDRQIETTRADGNHIAMRWDWRRKKMSAAPVWLREMEFVEALRSGPFAFHGHHAAFAYDWKGRLGALDHEILALRANDDLWIPTGRARPFIRNGRMVDLPDMGREMILVHYRQAGALLREFFDRADIGGDR